MIKNTVIEPTQPVEIFVDGGIGNRMGQVVAGCTAARLYGREAILHWPLNKHCLATTDDIYSALPCEAINYPDDESWQVALEHAEILMAEYENNRIGVTGGAHFGLPGPFHRNLESEFKDEHAKTLATLKPSAAVAARMVDLRGEVDAYAIRTLRHVKFQEIYKVPAGSFLTTDSERAVAENPRAINLQTVFSHRDYGIQRDVAGMIEAAADWWTMFTAKRIFFSCYRSTYTLMHEQVADVERHCADQEIAGCTVIRDIPEVTAILPGKVLDSCAFGFIKQELEGQGCIVTTHSVAESYRPRFDQSINLITWGVKWKNYQYKTGNRNVLFIENGLLRQQAGFYIDHEGYFSSSSMVGNHQEPTPEESEALTKHVLQHLKYRYGVTTYDPDGPILLVCQMNGDSPLRHYFSLAEGITQRVASFLGACIDHLPKDREVIIRPHPREKLNLHDLEIPDHWSIEGDSHIYPLLPNYSSVVTVNSTVATEALALGMPVATLGTGAFTEAGVMLDCSTDVSRLASITKYRPNLERIHNYLCTVLRHQLPYGSENALELTESNHSFAQFISRLR